MIIHIPVIGQQLVNKQWRMLEIEATEQNVLFPIPFTQWCVASGSRVTGTGGNPTTLGANAAFHQIATLTHAAVFSVEAQEYYLFVAGVQQWGYNLATLGNGTTYNLLITCSDFNLGYISNNAGAGEICGCEATLTTIQLSRTTHSNTLCWAALGKQQWGSNFSTVTAETLVDYPIAVSQVLTILCAADQTDIRDAEYAAPGTVTDTNFIAVTFALFGSTHARPYPYYWIMVGIVQQWGLASKSDITFPTAFSDKNYALVITTQANLEDAVYHWDSYYQSKTTSKCTFPTEFPKYFMCIGL